MIPISQLLLALFPGLLFIAALLLDYYSYRKKLEKLYLIGKKKKSNVIKLYNENYPFSGGGFVEPESFINKEKDHAK